MQTELFEPLAKLDKYLSEVTCQKNFVFAQIQININLYVVRNNGKTIETPFSTLYVYVSNHFRTVHYLSLKSR